MKTPLFSVVIPLYQKRHLIANCLKSVLQQSMPPFEVIVVDDGSRDGGGDVVQQHGDRVRYIRQHNQGVAVARNVGMALATGTHIAFLDADDCWQPNHLDTMAQLIRAFPDASIYGTGWADQAADVHDPSWSDDGTVVDLARFVERTIANRTPFWTGAVVLPRDKLALAALFPAGSRVAEDQDAWIEMLRVGPGVRSGRVTAVYTTDAVSPTIAAPNAGDFSSVIFTKWQTDPRFQQPLFADFVASHRLYTIRRHVGFAPAGLLLGHTLRTRSRKTLPMKLKVLTLLLMQAAGFNVRFKPANQPARSTLAATQSPPR